MRSYREEGILVDDSYVWKEGMAEWQRFADVPELAPPPPPPPAPPTAPSPPVIPVAPAPIALAPAPKLGPLQAAAVPEKIRTLGAPVEEAPPVVVEPEHAFTIRQLQLGLAALALAILLVLAGAIPRPWWSHPKLALTVFGVEPEEPGGN